MKITKIKHKHGDYVDENGERYLLIEMVDGTAIATKEPTEVLTVTDLKSCISANKMELVAGKTQEEIDTIVSAKKAK